MQMTLRKSLLLIITVTVYRLILLAFDSTDLFVDEAQYWLWSQDLDFGYYSKPPMIAWIIHVFTAIGGSDSIFWIRVGSPLLHMATALMLIPATARLTGSREAGFWVGASYATLPAVALSSVFMSTDTVLFPFLALTLLAYSHLIERRSIAFALLMGAAIGCGTLSKYAMLYFVGTASLSALLLPHARMAIRDTLIAAVTAIAVIAPNIWWNATHGAATLKHTSDNAAWNGLNFKLDKAAEFLSSQFAVIGPVLFAAMIVVLVRLLRGRGTAREAHLALLSWPIIIAIVGQALMSRAYANWAATAYAAGTMLAVLYLLNHSPRALKTSLVVNGTATLAFPLICIFAQDITWPNGRPILERYLGRAALSERIAEAARIAGTEIIVADNRDILADLFHTLRDQPFVIRTRKPDQEPRNFYQQAFPLGSAEKGSEVLYVSQRKPACVGTEAHLIADLSAQDGYRAARSLQAYRVAANCLVAD